MIKDLRELEKLLKICRRQGVTHLRLGDVSLKLGDLPQEQSKIPDVQEIGADPYANFPTGDLSPTQLMFYSAGGQPEDDPENKENQQ